MVFWVAFDMDSTLGYFGSLSNYLMCLYPEDQDPETKVDINIKAVWKPKIDAAFNEFVKLISENQELTKVLRPGIINVISFLLKAKEEGKVGGLMIYSNNPQKYMVYFVNKLISHLLNTPNVFCPLVYLGDPIRGDENTTYFKNKDTIVKCFLVAGIRDGCSYGLLKRKNIDPTNIIFFDDLIHNDIYEKIPKENYFHVEPYIIYPDQREIHAAFLWSLM